MTITQKKGRILKFAELPTGTDLKYPTRITEEGISCRVGLLLLCPSLRPSQPALPAKQRREEGS
jgi:hypothetical protein